MITNFYAQRAISKSKLDLSPKSRKNRNGGECDGGSGNGVVPGESSNRCNSLQGSGIDTVTQEGYQEENLQQQQRQKEGQPIELNQQYKCRESDQPPNVTTNHNNNSSNATDALVADVLAENYRRQKSVITESSSSNPLPNHRNLNVCVPNDCPYPRPATQGHPVPSPITSEQLSPRSFNHQVAPPPLINALSHRTPPLTKIKPNHIESSSEIRGSIYHNPGVLRGGAHTNLEEEILDRGESNEIASGRSSVGPLVIAEEDCSSTTPNTAFIPEDRNIRSELAHGPHVQPKSFGNIGSNNIPISQVRNPAFIDRKRGYQDISMDRYNSGSTPMANSHVSSRHRSPPPSSPHRSNRSQHHSRESAHSLNAMQRTIDLPPPQGSPPPPMNLPPLPPLSHRASASTTLSPTVGGEPERGRSHSRPSSWSNAGRSRLEHVFDTIYTYMNCRI